ncbi:hypothetical protein CEXT_773851 [Caerostris extrusa]|uniref:Uncharacterized protein n=1 Tax=Caerostris extrusa TaxID=172846 RepID=A0AAV4X4D6_CAEEX|nr:hypothetical protein CEXT_773851 [Caerostris extrusa]
MHYLKATYEQRRKRGNYLRKRTIQSADLESATWRAKLLIYVAYLEVRFFLVPRHILLLMTPPYLSGSGDSFCLFCTLQAPRGYGNPDWGFEIELVFGGCWICWGAGRRHLGNVP